MKSSDILLSVIIIAIFLSLILGNNIVNSMDGIKKNWNQYRCNPTMMPFAGYFGHDPVKNFTYCLTNMQNKQLTHIFKPLEYVMQIMTHSLGNAFKAVNVIREKIADFVNMVKTIVESIFGIFFNMLVQFQHVLIKLKDSFVKTLGISFTTMYLVQTGMHTGKSLWAGPVGKTMRFICFVPDTLISMKDGTRRKIKDVNLGDTLQTGSKVLSTMKIVGNSYEHNSNKIYKIYSKQLQADVFVTAEHKIYSSRHGKFIPVREYKDAIETDMIVPELSCLVTDDHLIPVGEHMFWDWED